MSGCSCRWVYLFLTVAFPSISSRFKDTFVNVVGHRVAERSLQLGSLHSAPEAHRLGLVDELVPDEKLQEKTGAVMAQWLALPGKGGTSSRGTGDLIGVGRAGTGAGTWELHFPFKGKVWIFHLKGRLNTTLQATSGQQRWACQWPHVRGHHAGCAGHVAPARLALPALLSQSRGA